MNDIRNPYDRWEIIRRHRDYRNFCDKHQFDEDGFINAVDFLSSDVQAILDRFGLTSIPHYMKNLTKEEVFNLPIFKDFLPVRFVFHTKDNHNGVPLRTIFSDENQIVLKLDITKPWEQLEKGIKDHIEIAREEAELPKRQSRGTASNHGDDLRVFDLLKEGKAPGEIIKELWPDETASGVLSQEQDVNYKKLVQKYKNKKLSDYLERAHKEAYGNNMISNNKLYVRVYDCNARIKKFLSYF